MPWLNFQNAEVYDQAVELIYIINIIIIIV